MRRRIEVGTVVMVIVAILQIVAPGQTPQPVQGYKCGVSGGGRDCPQQSTTTFSYYCSETTAGAECGGPALPTDYCATSSSGGSCGYQISVMTGEPIYDPNDPTVAVACSQTYSICYNVQGS